MDILHWDFALHGHVATNNKAFLSVEHYWPVIRSGKSQKKKQPIWAVIKVEQSVLKCVENIYSSVWKFTEVKGALE